VNLPFFISYHPDLFNEEERVVVEIKSSSLENEGESKDQAILQLSSYAHFLGARKAKLIFYEVKIVGEQEVEVVPIERLRSVWLEGWRKLVKLGRVILR
jgi:ribosome modulation factor